MKRFFSSAANVNTLQNIENQISKLPFSINNRFAIQYEEMKQKTQEELKDPRYKIVIEQSNQEKVKELLEEVEETARKFSIY